MPLVRMLLGLIVSLHTAMLLLVMVVVAPSLSAYGQVRFILSGKKPTRSLVQMLRDVYELEHVFFKGVRGINS